MLRAILLRLRSLLHRQRAERELDDELSYHLEQQTAHYISRGLDRETARNIATRELDGVEHCKEECRDARGVAWIEDLWRDLRYAARTLRRSPAFTATVILSLALGIGANTAIFSVLDALILRMLPVRNPAELVTVEATAYIPFLKTTVTVDMFPRRVYVEFRDHSNVFSDTMGLLDLDRPEIVVDGLPESGSVECVSGNFFTGLGVTPVIGRPIDLHETSVAVISYGYWKRRFAKDPAVIGKKLAVNDAALTIVGVAPSSFFGVSPDHAPDLWAPLDAPQLGGASPQITEFIVARLKPGATSQQASANLQILYSQIPDDLKFHKGNSQDATMQVQPAGNGLSSLRSQFSRPLEILMIVVVLVLVTACANVANLLLARATVRQREMATRLAIGAGRGRLIRQLLTESLLLAALGGGAGLVLARWGNGMLLNLLPTESAPLALQLQPRILAFNFAVALFTGLAFGIVPAIRGTNLQELSRFASNIRLAKLLVMAQVSLSLVLLFSAGLFVRNLERLKSVDFGFRPDNIVQVTLDTRGAGYRGDRLAATYRELLTRLSHIPGVRSVSAIRNGLIQNGNTSTNISVPGWPDASPVVESADVGPQFFETTGVPLVAGRDFSFADNEQSPKVVIVNDALVQRFFGGQNPVGRRIGNGAPGNTDYEIVGVVKDAKLVTIRQTVAPAVYFPGFQRNRDRVNAIEIRTAGDPASVVVAARQTVLGINKRLLVNVKTLPQQIDDMLIQERMIGKLAAAFGLLALVLASAGVYGVMAYSVARRTNEVGIRMALGAGRRDVLMMVLRETLTLVAAGVAIGAPLSFVAARLANHWVADILFGLKATDPASIAIAAVVLLAAAFIAGYLPARRASRIEPIVALRYE